MTRIALVIVAALGLGGCDQLGLGGGSGPATDTNMRSVDIQAGTASDEMILLDQASGDGTAVDPSSAIGPAAPRPADDSAADDETPTSSAGEGSDATNGDQVIRPPAGGAEPDGATEPAGQ